MTWRQGCFGLIKTVVRFEKWDEILDATTIPVYDQPEQNAWRHWATGLAYAAKGQMDNARAALARLQKDIEAAGGEPVKIPALKLVEGSKGDSRFVVRQAHHEREHVTVIAKCGTKDS